MNPLTHTRDNIIVLSLYCANIAILAHNIFLLWH